MKILIIHNKYGKFSGEEAVVETKIALLKANGHEVLTYIRSSEEIENMPLGKVRAFFTGIQNSKVIREVTDFIRLNSPDIVHIHNLYPIISPGILPEIKKFGIPVVMTVHNYRLVCPNGLFFTRGKVCESCTGLLKEWNCIRFNCEESYFKSVGYAARNFWARTTRAYLDYVDAFLCLTEFQKAKLIEYGFKREKCFVIPNIYAPELNIVENSKPEPSYVAYAGRFSEEKGIGLLLDAAQKLPHINFRLAGNYLNNYMDNFTIPENVYLCGMLKGEDLREFYKNAKFFVLTSIWYEGFPMVLLEAMAFKLPIIAPNFAGFPEIVENDNGLLYELGNVDSLANSIQTLWMNDRKCSELGEKGFFKVKEKYQSDTYYEALFSVYKNLLN